MKDSPFNRKSIADKRAKSPYDDGTIHFGSNEIEVKLIAYPEEEILRKVIGTMAMAPTGRKPDLDDDTILRLGNEIFEGGILNRLESFSFIFEIHKVSRACTHQLVRTRNASFHQQTMRYCYMGSEFSARIPKSISDLEDKSIVEEVINHIENTRELYKKLYNKDIPFQDARYVLPIGTNTYIIASYPIKVFLDTYGYRACPMMMWETVEVFRKMKNAVIDKLPFLHELIKISCEKEKKCMFQGFEKTGSVCDFPWNRERVYNPEKFLEKLSPREGDGQQSLK